MMRAAAVLAWVSGLGFGLPGVYAIWHLTSRGTIATFLGFPTYGEGTFERFGIRTSVPLLIGFVLVCAVECVVGWLLWGGHRAGSILALVMLPFELVFWVGFSLPFGPVLATARTALIVISWWTVRGNS